MYVPFVKNKNLLNLTFNTMDTLTKSFIDYLYKGWDQNKNPQAGFRFTFNGIECEIWLNTHRNHHFLYIFNSDGRFTAFQTNFFREPNHHDIRANLVIDALRGGFVELTPIEFDDSVEGCMIRVNR